MSWGNPMAGRWGKLYKGTPAELSLEDAVAELGVPYRTQFPGYLYGFRFFPDFLLPTLALVIEVDDDSHRKADKMLADAERTAELEARGWKVVRCTNDEALDDPRGTVRALLSRAGMWPLPMKRPNLRRSLPVPKSCPQKVKREASSARRQAKRRGSSPQRAPARRTSPQLRKPRPTPAAAPQPTQAPPV